MGFSFRKRVKLLPGVHLNVGKKGVSLSAGIKGASITKGHGRTSLNVGIPGTGISERINLASDKAPQAAALGHPLTGDRKTPLEVRGTQYCKTELDELFGAHIAAARQALAQDGEPLEDDDVGFHQVECAATLKLLDNNPHDPLAVGVFIAERHVGYLSRPMARAFRNYATSQGLRGSQFRCFADVQLPLHQDDAVSIMLDLPRLIDTDRSASPGKVYQAGQQLARVGPLAFLGGWLVRVLAAIFSLVAVFGVFSTATQGGEALPANLITLAVSVTIAWGLWRLGAKLLRG